jgi:phosphohistidine swiveling domain-containing protein
MERGITMLMHAAVIGVVLYVAMVYGLKQDASVAENRSILIAAAVLIYMVLFGHGLPTKMNENI